MSDHHELPPDKHEKLVKAVRLEWFSILYLLSAIVLLYFTLGSSQAMKAAWVEDILGLTPPIAFLVASRIRNRQPNDRFPTATTGPPPSPTCAPRWPCSP